MIDQPKPLEHTDSGNTMTPLELEACRRELAEASNDEELLLWARRWAEALTAEVDRLRNVLHHPDRGASDLGLEVQRVRSLLKRIFPLVDPRPGTEALQEELEREV